MDQKGRYPDINRVSVVLAFLSLALGMVYILPIRGESQATNILGFIIGVKFDMFSVIPLMIALLALAGSLWTFSSHHAILSKRMKLWQLSQNLIMPVLTVFIISITLRQMDRTPVWWLALILGLVIFGLVLVAEFNVILLDQNTQPQALVSLIALSYGLYLILCIALGTSEMRLYLQLPLLFLSGFIVTTRALYLRNQIRWLPETSFLIAVIPAQLAVGISYLFINPIQYGLILTGTLYALGSISSGLESGMEREKLFREPMVMVGIVTIMVLLVSFI